MNPFVKRDFENIKLKGRILEALHCVGKGGPD
jgi:hypothetical protein